MTQKNDISWHYSVTVYKNPKIWTSLSKKLCHRHLFQKAAAFGKSRISAVITGSLVWASDRGHGEWRQASTQPLERSRASLCLQERARGRGPRTCGRRVREVGSDPGTGTCDCVSLEKQSLRAVLPLFVRRGSGRLLKSLVSLMFWSQDSQSTQQILQCADFNSKHFGEQGWHSLSFIH